VRSLVTAVVIVVVAAACASSGDDAITRSSGDSLSPDAPTSSSMAPSTGTPIPVEPGGGIGDGSGGDGLPVVSPGLATEIDQAIADLATRLEVGTSSIVVLVAHELTWPDGSLGCPEPGGMYTQALVDGYRIELTDGDNVYEYHGAIGQIPFLCESAVGSG